MKCIREQHPRRPLQGSDRRPDRLEVDITITITIMLARVAPGECSRGSALKKTEMTYKKMDLTLELNTHTGT